MSQLLVKIKAEALQARKSRDAIISAALTTLIADVEAVGKSNNREVKDIEVVDLLKKYIKNSREVAAMAIDYNDHGRASIALSEVELYESFLPQQMNEDELHKAIQQIIQKLSAEAEPGRTELTIGSVMKSLKADYEGQYDGAMAAWLIKKAL